MKLMYDLFYAQPLSGSKFHGGGEYMKTIFKYLVENYEQSIDISTFYNPDKFIDNWLIELLNKYKVKVYFVTNKNEISDLLVTSQPDIFYTGMPYQYDGIQLPTETRKIATIHGLRAAEKPIDKYTFLYISGKDYIKASIKILFSDFFSNRASIKYYKYISMFDEIITDSNHSNFAIRVWLNELNNKKIITYYAPQKVAIENKLLPEYKKEIEDLGKYILLLGGNRWEKNIVRTIIAIEDLLDKKYLREVKIVICGELPKRAKQFIKHETKYIFYKFVDTDFLEFLYKNCDLFVYPTLNEGFGMPPLEAMKYGKTCVVSAVCSLPEICENAVYYINPYDIKEIENRILYAIKEKIEKEKVENQFKKISSRQENDLNRICDFIVSNAK